MVNYDRKVKYVLNDEAAPAALVLLEALSSNSKRFNYESWANILAHIESSEKSLGSYIADLHKETNNVTS